MKTYQFELTGKTPLLMHSDDINWADAMSAWKDDPANKKLSKAGDDRTPAFRWIGHAYNDGQNIVMPAENLQRALMEAGAMVPVPGGRSGKTFKAQTQSGMRVVDAFMPVIMADGKPVDWAKCKAMMQVPDFADHIQFAEKNGFSLMVKRAKVGTSKHIRVRPRFDNWRIMGTIAVWDDQITTQVLRDILNYAGVYKGLGDWRPSGKTPGSFGMFEAKLTEI